MRRTRRFKHTLGVAFFLVLLVNLLALVLVVNLSISALFIGGVPYIILSAVQACALGTLYYGVLRAYETREEGVYAECKKEGGSSIC